MADRIAMSTEPSQETPTETVTPQAEGRVSIPDTPATPAKEEQTSERPEWLPEKFESPEAMAEAYRALEKKLGSGEKGKEETKSESSTPASLDLAALTAEYEANQGLTDETYAKLQAAGLSRDVVDAVIDARVSQGDALSQAVYAEAGDQQAYEQMLGWARTGYTAAQAQAFDAALGAGTEAARMAVRALRADYIAANGSPPALRTAEPRGPASTGVKPFENTEQIYQAMRKPEYRTDPAFREEVRKRIAASNVRVGRAY